MSDKPLALVTGGGTGIGAACCRELANLDFRIAIHYRNSAAAAQALAAELPDAFCLQADICDEAQIENLLAEIKAQHGGLDVLVNNAGYNVNAPTSMMKLADYDAVAAVSRGTWYLSKLALRRFMLRKKSGRIINISSVVGHTGNPGQVPYTMAKAGLDAMSKSLAKEVTGTDIRVNSVAPGFIATDMTGELPEDVANAVLASIPMGRMGQPEDIAETVGFLASRASYIHGTVVHVNGGLFGG